MRSPPYFYRYFDMGIADARFRRTWNGLLALQIRRYRKRMRIKHFGGVDGAMEDCGLTEWRDADGNSPSEVAEAMALISKPTQVTSTVHTERTEPVIPQPEPERRDRPPRIGGD